MFGWLTLRRRVERLESKVARIQQLYQKTLSYRDSDPETALMNARKAAEAICSRVFEHKLGKSPKSMTLKPLIERLTQIDALPESILVSLRTIQGFGNLGSHHQPDEPTEMTPKDAEPCLAALGIVVQWYFNEYGSGAAAEPIVRSPRPRLGQLGGSRNTQPWIATITGTIAAVALLLWGVAAWNSRNRFPANASSVNLPVLPAATPIHAANAGAQESAKPPSSAGQSNTPNTPPASQTSVPDQFLAAGRPRLAVLPFRCSTPDASDPAAIADELTSTLTSRLANSRLVSLVERDQLDKVFEELDLSRNARFNPAEVAKIGRLLGAKQLLLGSFYQDAKAMRVDARIVDTETAFVLSSALRKGKPEDATALIESLCDDVVKSLEEASQQAEKEPK